ncbi:MAG: PQQ-binding-like beta-propeller repeat protein [Planctomycetia bacterium]|nr:PQQ-binding-like beta-propeller repeat protein [Planctomycetia bacterium]
MLRWFSTCGTRCLLALVLSAGVAPSFSLAAAPRGGVIPEPTARRHGLTRAWAAQLSCDPGRDRVAQLTLLAGALIGVTDQSTVQAIDAETGRTMWVAHVGRRDLPNTPVGANEKYVAVCNGSTLYVLDRGDGREIFSRRLQGTPAAAPAISDTRVYVPTFKGGIETYEVELPEDDPDKPRIMKTFRSKGIIEEAPVLAGTRLIWATHAGYVYSADKESLEGQFRFTTRGAITAGLAYRPPLVYTASADGYVYAINENTGLRQWQFSTGYPVREQPVAIGENVYAIPDLSGMYCLSADKGLERWFTRNVAQFVSASATRLYTADEPGQMIVVDARSGAHVDRLAFDLYPIKVLNIQTDRIYLATATGLVQCLREIEQVQPLVHAAPPVEAAPAGPGPKPAAAAEEAPAEAPAAEPAAADDPFGGAEPK